MPTTVFSTTLPNPSPDEKRALAVAAFYLKRGTTAATQMLRITPTPERDLLLESLKDSMLSASELCGSLAGDLER